MNYLKKNLWVAAAVLVAVLLIGMWAFQTQIPNAYTPFASCLKERGVLFYGAFWCPHCVEQKKMFGSAAKALPYVECSTPNGQGQIPLCVEKNIDTYPTWSFADGSMQKGVLSFEALAEKSGCQLPQ